MAEMGHGRTELLPGARHGRRRRWLRWTAVSVILLLAAVVLAHTVFVRWVSSAIVWAPNHGETILPRSDPSLSELVALGVSRHLRVAVGPPGASLSVWVIEPAGRQEPRGTLLVLHGIRDTKRTMLGLGRALAARGYRAVLPDLRGHGRSSGDWLTFGAVESRDLSQLLDELARRGLLARRVGVYGASYGGATAILLAARDPRIAAVVAAAPFASAREVIHAYMRRVYPRWLVPDAWIDRAIDSAGEAASFDPQEADPSQAIRRSNAPVLLIHGRQDRIIGWKQSRRLHEAAPTRSRLILLEHAGHAAIFRDKNGTISREALGWFDRWVALPKASRRAES